MMTSVSTIEAHQEHCQPYLLTLRMIAHHGTGPVLTRLGAEVAQATQTVLAEAEAADFGQLRCHLHRFEALTAAIWTVLQAVHGAGGPGRSAG